MLAAYPYHALSRLWHWRRRRAILRLGLEMEYDLGATTG